jgi:hypothetical protein
VNPLFVVLPQQQSLSDNSKRQRHMASVHLLSLSVHPLLLPLKRSNKRSGKALLSKFTSRKTDYSTICAVLQFSSGLQ